MTSSFGKKNIPQWLILIATLILYSVGGMAYLHNTFAEKDYTDLIFKRLDRIENKLDSLIDKI